MQKASRGRFGIDKAYQIQDFARNSFGFILASSSLSLIIKQYIEQLKSFESSIDIFDAEIAKIYDNFDCKIHSIIGIGKTLAAVIFSEIGGDISKERKRSDGKEHLNAIGHVCHKLISIIFAVLRYNKPYVPA